MKGQRTFAAAALIIISWGLTTPASGATLGEVDPLERISFGGTYLQEPRLAVNDEGDALAVWRQDDGTPTYIWASHSRAGGPWSDAIRLSAYTINDPQIPRVAAGPDGSFIVAWTLGSSSPDFYFTWYHPASGWDTPAVASLSPGHTILDWEMAADGLGNAFVVVLEQVSASINLSAVRYTAGSGWGSMAPLESSTDQVEPTTYSVVADDAGNATAVWVQIEGSYKSILSNHYTPGTGWMGVVHLESDTNHEHQYPVMAGRPSGEVVVAWSYGDGSRQRIGANSYLPATGWSGLVTVDDTTDGNNGAASVAFAGQNAVVAWSRVNGSTYDNNAAVGFGATWGFRANLSFLANGQPPRVAGSGGSAVVSWVEIVGAQLFGVRFVEGQGWSARGRLFEADPTYNPSSWTTAADREGNAIVAWYTPSPLYLVYAVWIRESVAPPVNITAPGNFAVVDESSVLVEGTTEPGAWVAANGVVADVDEFGRYSARVPLHAGSNDINVMARDGAGNQARVSVHITFDDPVPALEASLAAAEARADALEANLTAANTSLTAAMADVAAAEAAVAALELSGNATAADLAAARANLSAAHDRVDGLQSQVTTLAAQLVSANARITALEAPGAPGPAADNTLALLALVLALAAAALAGVGVVRGKGGAKRVSPPLDGPPPAPPKNE